MGAFLYALVFWVSFYVDKCINLAKYSILIFLGLCYYISFLIFWVEIRKLLLYQICFFLGWSCFIPLSVGRLILWSEHTKILDSWFLAFTQFSILLRRIRAQMSLKSLVLILKFIMKYDAPANSEQFGFINIVDIRNQFRTWNHPVFIFRLSMICL